MTIDGNNDPEYVVFGYGSLIFRVRKNSSLRTHQPANLPLAPTARHQRKYVGLSLFVRCTHYGSKPRDFSKATSVDSHRNHTTTAAHPQYAHLKAL